MIASEVKSSPTLVKQSIDNKDHLNQRDHHRKQAGVKMYKIVNFSLVKQEQLRRRGRKQ